ASKPAGLSRMSLMSCMAQAYAPPLTADQARSGWRRPGCRAAARFGWGVPWPIAESGHGARLLPIRAEEMERLVRAPGCGGACCRQRPEQRPPVAGPGDTRPCRCRIEARQIVNQTD